MAAPWPASFSLVVSFATGSVTASGGAPTIAAAGRDLLY
jgi:hypothetical protein